MSVSAYSVTSLVYKLGINPEMTVLLLNAPYNYCRLLEIDNSKQVAKSGNADFYYLFATSKKELENQFNSLIKQLLPETIGSISWNKKSAKI
ncbi:MAG: hypothetical protein ABIS69_08895 [Sediminibacterium sp.]